MTATEEAHVATMQEPQIQAHLVGAPARWTAPDGVWAEPDLHLFPQDGHRYEIVDGSLHVAPPSPAAHEALVRAVLTTLRAAAPPGWWVCDRLGVGIGASNVVPDVTVLRPRSSGAVWSDPADVALVVEVEAPATRRYDRMLKPALYADAGIRSYWRVEPGPVTPILHAYELLAGAYQPHRRAEGAEPVKLDAPYPLRITPSAWI
jgi:Uma2 family endonuclease